MDDRALFEMADLTPAEGIAQARSVVRRLIDGVYFNSASMCFDLVAEHGIALQHGLRDSERLDFLDANPKLILRSGKQHIRALIDVAIKRTA